MGGTVGSTDEIVENAIMIRSFSFKIGIFIIIMTSSACSTKIPRKDMNHV